MTTRGSMNVLDDLRCLTINVRTVIVLILNLDPGVLKFTNVDSCSSSELV